MKTLQQIHEDIEACELRLEDIVEELYKVGPKAARADAAYKTKFAKERLAARANADGRKITVDEVEDRATDATEQERLDHLLAANELHVLREVRQATSSQLDGLRTQAASFRGAGG